MAEKVSLKIFIIILLLCGILSACRSPIDIEVFFAAPEVKAAIDAIEAISQGKVNIYEDDSEDGLEAGNGEISGLIPGRYYRIEEYDQDETPTSKKNFFVQSTGKPNADLGKIGPLEGNKISGLQNYYWYKVKLARPFDKDGTYKYFNLDSSVNSGDAVKIFYEGEVAKVTVRIIGDDKYYLDISDEIKAEKIYKVKANIESWNSSSRSSAHSKLTGTASISSLNIDTTTNYIQDFPGNIGIYQYRIANNTTFTTKGGTPLTGKSIIELDNTTPLSNYVFVEYKDTPPGEPPVTTDKAEITGFTFLSVELKQVPVAGDFTINGTGTFPYDGSPKTVTITPNQGKSSGTVTVKYNGNTTAPTDAGIYTVTFDVAAATGWEAVSGLSAGTLTIEKATPVVGDYDISGNTATYDGNSKTVTITVKQGNKSTGTVTVKYNGSTTAPINAGSYTVTFDVAVDPNWEAAPGLSAGTLTIEKATPTVGDYDISGTGTVVYDGSPKTVTITPKQGKSIGTVTVKYNGSTTAPINAGSYTVTFDVAVDPNWKAISGLSVAENLTIIEKLDLFKFSVNWDKEPPTLPIFNTTGTVYNKTTGKIYIKITITNNTNWNTYKWTSDFSNTPLSTKIGEPYTIDLDFDEEDAPSWGVNGEFAIYINLDNGANIGKITFSLPIYGGV